MQNVDDHGNFRGETELLVKTSPRPGYWALNWRIDIRSVMKLGKGKQRVDAVVLRPGPHEN